MYYRYQFPLSGTVSDPQTIKDFEDALEFTLNGPEGPIDCFSVEKRAEFFKSSDLESDGKRVTALNIYTYLKLPEENEESFYRSVKNSIRFMMENAFDIEEGAPEYLHLTGNMIDFGPQEEIPETLYHITSGKNFKTIKDKGLLPERGPNDYQNTKKYVFLSDERNAAAWLSILQHVEDPIILEVDASNVVKLEPGRAYGDRSYTETAITEWRTEHAIPTSAVRMTDLKNGLGDKLRSGLIEYSKRACDSVKRKYESMSDSDRSDLRQNAYKADSLVFELSETTAGLERLAIMGVMDKPEVENVLRETGVVSLMRDMKDIKSTAFARYFAETYESGDESDWADEMAEGFEKGVKNIKTEDPNQKLE